MGFFRRPAAALSQSFRGLRAPPPIAVLPYQQLPSFRQKCADMSTGCLLSEMVLANGAISMIRR